MMNKYDRQSKIKELIGLQRWDDVVDWFGGMARPEIRAELVRCFGDVPSNNDLGGAWGTTETSTDDLADMIYQEV